MTFQSGGEGGGSWLLLRLPGSRTSQAIGLNNTTVAASRSNVTIINAYGAWGDPDLYPAEYDSGHPYHPLLPGLARVSTPLCESALTLLIV